MDAGDITAIYAAVVATAALGWQVFQWRHRRKSHVSVDVKLAIFPMTAGGVRDGVTIDVTNRSERPIRVTSAGLFMQDGSRRTFVQPQQPPGAELPGIVESYDSKLTYFWREDLTAAGFDLTRPLQAWANLATGEQERSPKRTLLSD